MLVGPTALAQHSDAGAVKSSVPGSSAVKSSALRSAKADAAVRAEAGKSREAQPTDRVFFARASSRISARGRKVLLAMATLLKSDTAVDLRIVGHADTRGSAFKNQLLSERRARSVAAYLERLGVDKRRLRVEGAGSRQPLPQDGDQPADDRSRRADLYLETATPQS